MIISNEHVAVLELSIAELDQEANNITRLASSIPMDAAEQYEFNEMSKRLFSMAEALKELREEMAWPSHTEGVVKNCLPEGEQTSKPRRSEALGDRRELVGNCRHGETQSQGG